MQERPRRIPEHPAPAMYEYASSRGWTVDQEILSLVPPVDQALFYVVNIDILRFNKPISAEIQAMRRPAPHVPVECETP